MNERLAPADRERALRFTLAQGEPLDRALCRHHLQGGAREAVLEALGPLQGADGGFRGMEPDFAVAASSVLCTLRALEILAELEVAARAPIVERALAFLLEAYVPAWHSWPLVPPHDNAAPHAPWWRWSEEFAEGWGFFADNPRPQAAALLHHFGEALDARGRAVREEATEAVVARATGGEGEAAEAVEKDALECYLRFAAAPAVPAAARDAVRARLEGWAAPILARDPAGWAAYGLQPLDVAPTPASPLHAPFREDVARHLDHLIATQEEDGGWSPYWTWMGAFPEAWPRALRAWRAILTTTRLRQLEAHGRAPLRGG